MSLGIGERTVEARLSGTGQWCSMHELQKCGADCHASRACCLVTSFELTLRQEMLRCCVTIVIVIIGVGETSSEEALWHPTHLFTK
jgi:hypothetical protein